MRTIWTTVLSAVMALALPLVVSGQTDVRALQDALHGKQLELRSYSADPVAEYKWVNGGLVTGTVNLHGLEVFLTDSVSLKKGKIVFQGNRVTLVRNGTDVAAAGRSPMRLEVELNGADPAAVLPQLQDALFFPALQARQSPAFPRSCRRCSHIILIKCNNRQVIQIQQTITTEFSKMECGSKLRSL